MLVPDFNVLTLPTPHGMCRYVNLAFSEFTVKDGPDGKRMVELSDWRLVDAQVPSEYNVTSYAKQGRIIINDHLWSASNSPTLYIMERQSLRPIGTLE